MLNIVRHVSRRVHIEITKKTFKLLLDLGRKQPWIIDKSRNLESLIDKDCTQEVERELIVGLISRIKYLSQSEFSKAVNDLAESIVTDIDLSSSTTQVVAMTGDYSSDSGAYLLYALKLPLEKLGWRDHLTCSNFQKSLSKFKKNGNDRYTFIVLIDEFIGSGQTAIGRVNKLLQQYEQFGVNVRVKVKVIAASSVGIKALAASGIELEYMYSIEMGITEFYNPEEVPDKISLMLELESKLSEEYNGRKLPSLGYGETESLYYREDGNLPNSVFPIFWWPFYKDNSKREVLLIRAMGDA